MIPSDHATTEIQQMPIFIGMTGRLMFNEEF